MTQTSSYYLAAFVLAGVGCCREAPCNCGKNGPATASEAHAEASTQAAPVRQQPLMTRQTAGPTASASHPTFADGFVPTRELWVDVDFDASKVDPKAVPSAFFGEVYVGDGTKEHPFKNIHQAVSSTEVSAKPGTRINVRKGVYGDRGTTYAFYSGKYRGLRDTADSIIFRTRGAAGAPIMLYSVDGPGAAVIDGKSDGNDQGNGLMLIQNNDYIIIDGFEVRNCQQNIHIGNGFGTSVVIRNCHVHHAITGDCIKVNQMDKVYIENCVVHDPGLRRDGVTRQEPIDYVAVNEGHIVNNEIFNCDFGVYAKGGSRNILFEGNYVHDCRASGIALGGFTDYSVFYKAKDEPGDDTYECYNCNAFNNVVANVALSGIECIGCIDSAAEFNTLWNCAQGVSDKPWDEPVMVRPGYIAEYWYKRGTKCSIPKNFTFRNNIVANADGGMSYPFRSNDMGCGQRADPKTIHVSGNLWWSKGTTLSDGNPANHIPVLGDPNSLYDVDPQLASNDLPRLLPRAGSPVLGRGTKNERVTTDFAGRKRGDRPAWGAFEAP